MQAHINGLQFGGAFATDGDVRRPSHSVTPTWSIAIMQLLELEREPVELRHAMGETDDATWVWMPRRRLAMVGDLIVSSLPNTGNPNKVQRYTLEWAEALGADRGAQARYRFARPWPRLSWRRSLPGTVDGDGPRAPHHS